MARRRRPTALRGSRASARVAQRPDSLNLAERVLRLEALVGSLLEERSPDPFDDATYPMHPDSDEPQEDDANADAPEGEA